MKVLFLDIDGVLKEESYKAAFQDECFARLKRIIDATDAQIILTSSWRVNYWKFVEDGFQTENEDVLRLHEYFESLCSQRKSDIIGDMKKEYEATNYESDLTDEQGEAIKKIFLGSK